MELLEFVRLGWTWFRGDGMGDEAEEMGKSYYRVGLKGHSKESGFYHLCVGGSLQMLIGFVCQTMA